MKTRYWILFIALAAGWFSMAATRTINPAELTIREAMRNLSNLFRWRQSRVRTAVRSQGVQHGFRVVDRASCR